MERSRAFRRIMVSWLESLKWFWMWEWLRVLLTRKIQMIRFFIWRCCCKLIKRCKGSLRIVLFMSFFRTHRRFFCPAGCHIRRNLALIIRWRLIDLLTWFLFLVVFYLRFSFFFLQTVLEVLSSLLFLFFRFRLWIFIFVTITWSIVVTIIRFLFDTFKMSWDIKTLDSLFSYFHLALFWIFLHTYWRVCHHWLLSTWLPNTLGHFHETCILYHGIYRLIISRNLFLLSRLSSRTYHLLLCKMPILWLILVFLQYWESLSLLFLLSL